MLAMTREKFDETDAFFPDDILEMTRAVAGQTDNRIASRSKITSCRVPGRRRRRI